MPRLRSRKALWLFALLATRANRPVSREWIATTLWPDVDLAAAFANLRPVISELRRALGDHGERLHSIDRSTVQLDLAGVDVDLIQFDRAMKVGDFATAISLYTGPLLEDCAEEWVPQERVSREAECLRALQTLGERAAQDGHLHEAAVLFRRAMTLDPWRDPPRRHLMKVLAQLGDVNAALQVYREYANLLSAESSDVPDPETTALYRELRAKARGGEVKLRVAPVSAKKPAVSGYLPHPLTDLIGREDDCADLSQLVKTCRLVTLVGSGGIGKTRLATAVAQTLTSEFSDGVWLIALEGIEDDRFVLKQIATTLCIPDEVGQTDLQIVKRHLLERNALLVLDNCEHVLQSVASSVQVLLRDCGRLRILATSREPLGITGERSWTVTPLAAPSPDGLPEGRTTLLRVMEGYESVKLFCERAKAVQPSFELTAENAKSIAQICSRLDGVPFAIELAAARLRSMTISQIAARLEDALSLLTTRPGTANQRQQTLRSMIDWSYKILTPTQQNHFRLLAVFANGWTLSAAESVVGSRDVEADLFTLVDKSLVVFDAQHARYRFLETVRQYASELLDGSGEREAAERRYLHWVLDLATKAEQELVGPNQDEWAKLIDLENDNVRWALQRFQNFPEEHLAVAGAMTRYWYYRHRYSEGREQCEAALREGSKSDDVRRASALRGAGTFAYAQGDLHAAARHWTGCIEIHRRLGNTKDLAAAVGNMASLAFFKREFLKCVDLYREAYDLAVVAGEIRTAGLAMSNLGTAQKNLGDYRAALISVQRSLKLFENLKDDRMICWLLKELADVHQGQANFGEARALYEDVIRRFQLANDAIGIAWALESLSVTLAELGLDSLAEETQSDARARFEQLQNPMGLVAVTLREGTMATFQGKLDLAHQKLEVEMSAFSPDQIDPSREELLCARGELYRRKGQLERAAFAFQDALQHGQVAEAALSVAGALEGMAAVTSDGLGTPSIAVAHLALADQLREQLGTPIPNRLRPRWEASMSQLRSTLGDSQFDQNWERGKQLNRRDLASVQ